MNPPQPIIRSPVSLGLSCSVLGRADRPGQPRLSGPLNPTSGLTLTFALLHRRLRRRFAPLHLYLPTCLSAQHPRQICQRHHEGIRARLDLGADDIPSEANDFIDVTFDFEVAGAVADHDHGLGFEIGA